MEEIFPQLNDVFNTLIVLLFLLLLNIYRIFSSKLFG